MSSQDLQDILNTVYVCAVAETEALERRVKDGMHFNGHHAAQRIAIEVEAELARRGLVGQP